MRALTFATDTEGYYPLLRSTADRFGFELEVMGWGEPWGGMAAKMIRYREQLSHWSPDEIVMLVDAYDVVFNAPAAESELLFKEMRVPFLFSGQRYFPSNPSMRRRADQVMGLDTEGPFARSLDAEPYGRPCMGALMGHAGALVELFSKLVAIEARQHAGNDQILLNLHLQEHPDEAHVDHDCRIFQNLWRTRGPFPMRGSIHPRDEGAEVRVLPSGRLTNRLTGTHPQVIHGPMNLDLAPLLAAMGYGPGLHGVSGSKYFRYSMRPYLKLAFNRELSARKRLAGIHQEIESTPVVTAPRNRALLQGASKQP